MLATVFGILEDPAARATTLLREQHKAHATRYQFLASRWGTDPHWAGYLDVYKTGLGIIGNEIGLAADDVLKPEAIDDECGNRRDDAGRSAQAAGGDQRRRRSGGHIGQRRRGSPLYACTSSRRFSDGSVLMAFPLFSSANRIS